jgi:SAM-dependent methyltransferase
VSEGTVCNVCETSVDRTTQLQWLKNGYEILKCPECGTLFRADLPTPEDLARIYGPEYFVDSSALGAGTGYADYVREEANHRLNAAARVGLLERFQEVGSVVDVGSAAGFFLDEARKRGWAAEGVELAPEMAEYARDRFGLVVHAVPFADVDLNRSGFGAVTMWDYLEHSIDPAADLRKAAALLQPNGLLAVSTGDAGSLAARVFGSRWHLLTPNHHNFFFTRASLEEAFRRAGFQIVFVKYAWSRYSVQYLVHKLQTLSNIRALRSLAGTASRSAVGRRSIPINLFDIVTVIGRKRPS